MSKFDDLDSKFDKDWKKSNNIFRGIMIVVGGLMLISVICFCVIAPKLMNTGTLSTQGVFMQGDQVIINGEDTGKIVNTIPDLSINGISYIVSYRDSWHKWHKQKFMQVELVKIEPK